jgi:polysaccharide biosynthesis transport protein
MSFSQFLTILRARWVLVCAIFFGIVGLTLLVSLILPKKYAASAAVVIDVKSPDPIAGMVLPGMMAPGYIATQLDVLQSERVIRRAMSKLGIQQSQELRDDWQAATQGQGDFESWMANLILTGVEIKPSRESSVINVAYVARDPRFSAAMVNAIVDSYIETVLELRVEPAKQYSALFAGQAKAARDRLEAAQAALSAYQQEKGLLASDERMDVETARLNDLSSQLVALQAASADSSSRANNTSSNSAEVLNSQVVATLKAELSRQEARSKELSARFGNEHPQVLEQRASMEELRARIEAEIIRVKSSVGINNIVNQARESQIRKALEQQRQKLFRLKEQRDGASVLLRDVESAQRAYETIMARQNQSTVESQSTQTNVSVLKRAYPPSTPSSPKTLLNLIMAILVGGMAAIGTALLVEIRHRKIRTEEDVTEGLELPLLGVMPESSLKLKDETMAAGLVKKSALLTQRPVQRLGAPGA